MIRDTALAASGLLSRKIGGPSVFPPQPDGIWDMPVQHATSGRRVDGGGPLPPRPLHLLAAHGSPYPSFMTFDATSREHCIVRRVRTNTPLQALTLLNDPAFVRSRARARPPRMRETAAAATASDANRAARRLPPGASTARRARRARSNRRLVAHGSSRGFRHDPEAAARTITAPRGRRRFAPPSCAAWTIVANVLPEPRREPLTKAMSDEPSPHAHPPPLLRTGRRSASAASRSRRCWTTWLLAAAQGMRRRTGDVRRPGAALRRRRRSASSTCSWPARRRSSTCSTTSRRCTKHDGQDIPEEFDQGRAVRLHQGHAASCSASPFHVREARPVRRRDLRAAAAPGQASPTTSRIVRSMHTTQFNHAPAQIFMNTGHQVIGRPSMGSWLTYGLGSENARPARLRRAALGRERSPTAASRAGAAASCRPSTRASSSARAASRCCSSRIPTGSTATPRRESLDADQRPEPAARASTCGDPEIADAHRRLRDGLPHADQRAGADRHLEGAGDDPRAVRHRAGHRRRSPTTACWRAGWSSAASASSSSITAAGTPTAPASASDIVDEAAAPVPRRPIAPSPRCSRTSSSAACSTTRSSSGAASSAARR